VFLITLGKYLESRAKRRASAAVRQPADMVSNEATVVSEWRSVLVSPAQVSIGETLLIVPGAKVPLDAEVLPNRARHARRRRDASSSRRSRAALELWTGIELPAIAAPVAMVLCSDSVVKNSWLLRR
jgi:hypothetical protein